MNYSTINERKIFNPSYWDLLLMKEDGWILYQIDGDGSTMYVGFSKPQVFKRTAPPVCYWRVKSLKRKK